MITKEQTAAFSRQFLTNLLLFLAHFSLADSFTCGDECFTKLGAAHFPSLRNCSVYKLVDDTEYNEADCKVCLLRISKEGTGTENRFRQFAAMCGIIEEYPNGCLNETKPRCIAPFGKTEHRCELCCNSEKCNIEANGDDQLPLQYWCRKYPQQFPWCTNFKKELEARKDFKKDFDSRILYMRDVVYNQIYNASKNGTFLSRKQSKAEIVVTTNAGELRVNNLSPSRYSRPFRRGEEINISIWLKLGPPNPSGDEDFCPANVWNGYNRYGLVVVKKNDKRPDWMQGDDNVEWDSRRGTVRIKRWNYATYGAVYTIMSTTAIGKSLDLHPEVDLTGEDCYNATDSGHSYNGTTKYAKDKQQCKNWTILYKEHQSTCYDNGFPNNEDPKNLGNYCRNPNCQCATRNPLWSVLRQKPWCIVGDKPHEWEYCDIKQCRSHSAGFRGTIGSARQYAQLRVNGNAPVNGTIDPITGVGKYPPFELKDGDELIITLWVKFMEHDDFVRISKKNELDGFKFFIVKKNDKRPEWVQEDDNVEYNVDAGELRIKHWNCSKYGKTTFTVTSTIRAVRRFGLVPTSLIGCDPDASKKDSAAAPAGFQRQTKRRPITGGATSFLKQVKIEKASIMIVSLIVVSVIINASSRNLSDD